MDPVTLSLWIGIVANAIDLGGKVVANVRKAMAEEGLTDEQINAIERAGNVESQKRRDARAAMGTPTDGGS